MKDYLKYENDRNHRNHALYERFMRLAVGKDVNILVAHHITFEVDGEEPNEIPSVDTLMFCHELMHKVFGDNFMYYLAQLAVRGPEKRDEHFAMLLDRVERDALETVSPEVAVCLAK